MTTRIKLNEPEIIRTLLRRISSHQILQAHYEGMQAVSSCNLLQCTTVVTFGTAL